MSRKIFRFHGGSVFALALLGVVFITANVHALGSNTLRGSINPAGNHTPVSYRKWIKTRVGDTTTGSAAYSAATNRTTYLSDVGIWSATWQNLEVAIAKLDKDDGTGRGQYALSNLTLNSSLSSQTFPIVALRAIPVPTATVNAAAGTVTVTWAAATVDTGVDVTNIIGYDVYRSATGTTPTPATSETGWTKINDATVSGTSFVDNAANSTPDPVAATTYFYAIKILYRGHTTSVPRRTDYFSANSGSVVYPAAPPTFTSISPDNGQVGQTLSSVVVTGTNYRTGAEVVLRRSGSSDIAMTGETIGGGGTTITGSIAIPAGTVTGAWGVVVTNPDTQTVTRTGGFTVNPALSVNTIAPVRGAAGSTIPISDLAGSGFSGSPTVVLRRVGQTDISMTSVTVASSSQITGSFAIPITAATGVTWDVVVTIGANTATGANLFTVDPAPAPTVGNISPTSGVRGTTLASVTVTGTNYFTGVSVLLRKSGSTDILMSGETVGGGGTTITGSFILPSATSNVGTWDVIVTNADGQFGTGAGQFNITHPAPLVVSINPSIGQQGRTIDVINLVGSQFRSGATAALVRAGEPDNTFTTTTFASSIQLRGAFVIPIGAAIGVWNVRVINDDGQSATGGSFTVTAAPSIVLTPTSLPFSARAGDPNPPTQTFTVTNGAGGTLSWSGTEVTDAGVEGANVVPWLAFGPVAAATNSTTVTISINTTGLTAGTYTASIRIRDAAANNSPQDVAVTLTLSAPIPTISTITPPSGIRGTSVSVTIAGANFQATGVGAQARLFRAGSADILMTSEVVNGAGDSITASIPIPSSSVLAPWSVAVDNPDLGTSSLVDGFTVIAPAPTVGSISPTSGARGATVSATVIGTNFQTGAAVVLRRAGQTDIQMTGESLSGDTSIAGSIAIPAGTVTGAWDVVVINPDTQTATGSGFFTVTLPGPTVSTITPPTGIRGTSVSVTIAGANFQSTGVGAQVRLFRAGSADILMTSEVVNGAGDSITASIPIPSSSVLAPWSVAVDNPDLGTSSLVDGFTVIAPAPTVGSISPTSGARGATVSATVIGTNFQTGAAVVLRRAGQTDISMTSASVSGGTSIAGSIAIPAGTVTGAWDVVVINPDTQTVTSTGLFTVTLPGPTISTITPPSGIRGTSVSATITGANFQSTGVGAQVRLFRAGSADILMTSEVVNGAGDSITASIPIPSSSVLAPWSVAVDNPDGGTTSLADGFTVTAPAPTVTSISPSSGSQGATISTVTIVGTNFQTGARAVLRQVATPDIELTSETVTGDTTLAGSLVIPADAGLGEWNVVVTNPDGQSGVGALVIGVSQFSVLAPPPTVASISPNTGSVGTTASVTITGTNFLSGATAKIWRVGSADINMTSISVVNATTITASIPIPSGAVSGLWNVTVTNPGNREANLLDGFTVSSTVTFSAITATRVADTVGSAIRLSWTRTPAGAVDIYTISGASDAAAGVFTTTPASWALEFANVAGTTQDDATEVGQGTQKYYKIVPAGTTLTAALLQTEVLGKFDLLVGPSDTQPERFFVSIPIVPASTRIEDVIGTQVADSDFIAVFDINRNVSSGSVFSAGAWSAFPGATRLDTLEPGMAYGYQSGTSRSVTIVGAVRSADTMRTLTGGADSVNWIATSYPVPLPIASAGLNATTVGADPSIGTTVYQFDANALTIGDLAGFAVHNSASGWVNGGLSGAATLQLMPGRGYLMIDPTSGPITWTLTRPF